MALAMAPLPQPKEIDMWYFAWILGTVMAILLAVVAAMSFDAKEDTARASQTRH